MGRNLLCEMNDGARVKAGRRHWAPGVTIGPADLTGRGSGLTGAGNAAAIVR